MKIDQLCTNEKLQNLLNESTFLAGQNTSPRAKVEENGYEDELEHLELFERQQETFKKHIDKSPDRLALNDISSINENDMNLNASALRDALQTRSLNENSTPTKRETKGENPSTFTPILDQQTSPRSKFQDLNAKIDDIYSSLCGVIEKHCVSKQDLAKFILETEQKLESVNKDVVLKANKSSVANALHRKANKQDLMQFETNIVSKLEKVLVDIKGAADSQKEYTTKVENMLETKQKQVEKRIKRGHDELVKKMEQAALKEQQSQNKDEIQPEISKFFRNYALEIYGSTVLESDTQDSLGLKTIFDKIFESQFQKYDIDEKFNLVLTKNTKNMQNTFSDQLNEEIEELQLQINQLRKEKKKVKEEIPEPISEIENFNNALKVQKGLLDQKASIKDVCTLVDLKANSQDVFKIFDELKKSIQLVSSQKQSESSSNATIDEFLKEQKFINQNLCPLNCVAQYVWHGGFNLGSISEFNKSATSVVPKVGGLKRFESIKWSKETINTSPQSMQLENESITLSQEGIYQITFILFVPDQSKPQITMLLDNQQLLSTVDSSFVCHTEGLKQQNFTSFVNAERINQKLSFTIHESQSVKSLNETIASSSSMKNSTGNSIFSSSIQTRKNNILMATSGASKTVECTLQSQYYFSPDLTRAVLIVKKL